MHVHTEQKKKPAEVAGSDRGQHQRSRRPGEEMGATEKSDLGEGKADTLRIKRLLNWQGVKPTGARGPQGLGFGY